MTSDGIVQIRLRLPSAAVHVRVRGDGRPVVLLHGGGPGTSGDGWVDCMAACGPGVQLVAPDFPGFGHSGPLQGNHGYGNRAFVAVALELLDALCLARVTLAGHSMGAAVAAALAALHPERLDALMLLAPGGAFFGFTDYTSDGMAQIARTTRDPSEENVRALVGLMSSQDAQGRAAQVRKRMEGIRQPGIINVQRALLEARSSPTATDLERRAELAQRIRTFGKPVSLIWGTQEVFNPMELGERIRAVLPPDADYRVIAGAGHNIQYDQPQAVARVIQEVAAAGAT